jgi:cell wall-associated NlpC family hydrolase
MDAPTQFSCSTFTTYVAGHCGLHLPRYSISQSYVGRPIDPTEAKEGHLVFYGGKYAPTDADRSIAHVAIKSGPETIIHGSATRGKIVEQRYDERKVIMVTDPFPEGVQLLITLPRMIPDMDSALDLVRFWQKQLLGR